MNLNNILWVYNTRKILPKAPVVENFFGMNLIGEGIITTATGNPVSIITNKAQNAISTLISFNSENGVSEINLNGCGKNLFDKAATIHQNTIYGFVNIMPKDFADLTLSITDKDTSIDMSNISFGFSYGLTDGGDRTEINEGYRWIVNGGTKTSDSIGNTRSGKKLGQFAFNPNTQETFDKIIQRYNVQIEIGTQVTVCEPYTQGSNITISLGDTYYEGTLNLETGVLTADGQTVSLTPQTVALLAGNNTLWTDGDSVTITYRR